MALDACNRNYCKECCLPARSVWEGPGKHQHIALGVRHDLVREEKWKARLNRRWDEFFGVPMPEKAFFWNPDVEPDKIASYCLKTRKEKGMKVKGEWEWLTWNPVWETGFRWLEKAHRENKPEQAIPRKKRVSDSPENEGHADSPHYTVEISEKEGESGERAELTLADLWEVSGIRLERETLRDFVGELPTVMWRQPLSLAQPYSAVSEALRIHERHELLLAYLCGESLVCLLSRPSLFGETISSSALLSQDAAFAVVYVRAVEGDSTPSFLNLRFLRTL